jgi:hypothetical protein
MPGAFFKRFALKARKFGEIARERPWAQVEAAMVGLLPDSYLLGH